MVEKTKIKTDFELFHDTGIYERYMLNAAQFSAAKNIAETKMMQSLVFNEEGVRKGYSEFKRDAQEVTDIFQETWLRTEYDGSVRQAVAAEQFSKMREDADLYPYWRYLRTISLNPRDEHLLLVDRIFRIGDYESDQVMPPNGWNCGCGAETIDEETRGSTPIADGKASLEEVDPQFRFNPADQGILPKESHSYFEVLKNANSAKGEMFDE